MKSVRELFDEASLLNVAEHAAYLALHCPDLLMRAQVAHLLACDNGGALDDYPAQDIVALTAAIGAVASAALPAGTAVGQYTIEAHIGDGGSSSIYRAHRDIENVRQTVALKILRRSMHAPDARRQFDRERRALSALSHPFIAQLIDGGIAPDGTAFLAIELVSGLPITDYARQQNLGFRARLRLFEQVARAVAAAHRALIVHRDLKPGNVMVTFDGHVKLLDFGIAKLLDEVGEQTQTAFQAFTPAYAAPEQRERGQITTATDVYALGILLGELLTGQRVTDGQLRTPSACVTDQTTTNGTLPASPNQTRKLLRGDLDNIVLKALEPEPDRRYASAGEFADDIERLLAGQPVKAYPPSRWYRIGKFVKRNRVSTMLVSALTLALLATVLIALNRAHQAQLQARRAELVASYIVALFDSAAPGTLPEDRMPPEQMIADGAKQLLANAQFPAPIKINLLRSLITIANGLGDVSQAQQLAGELRRLSNIAYAPGSVQRLQADRVLAETMLAAERYQDAVDLLAYTDVGAAPISEAQAQAMMVLATAYGALGNEASAKIAQAIVTRVGKALPALRLASEQRFALMTQEALFWSNLRAFAEGQKLAQAALNFYLQQSLRPSNDVLDLYQALAACAAANGEMQRATAAYEDGIALSVRMYGPEHHRTAQLEALLGSFLIVRGDFARAEPLVFRALALRTRLLGETHYLTLQSLSAAARLRLAQRRTEEAHSLLYQVKAGCAKRSEPNTACAGAQAALGRSLLLSGALVEAGTELAAALALQERISGVDAPQLITPLAYLAELQAKSPDYAQTLTTVQRIEAIAARTGGYRTELLLAQSRRAQANLRLGNAKACAAELAEVEPSYSALLPKSHGERRAMLRTRAQCAVLLGAQADAAGFARTVLSLSPEQITPDVRAALNKLAESK